MSQNRYSATLDSSIPLLGSFRYHATMIITHATHHRWEKQVTEDPTSEFGKSNRTRVRSSLRKIADTKITYAIEPLSEETIKWFTPLYNETLSSKDNPKLFDIYGTTLGKDTPYSYYSLTLFENGEPVGATIFSERTSYISVAYRIYPNQWKHHDLQANPSLYTEYVLNVHAFERGYRKLSHGRDRNPYGPNAQIGLAIFKLSIGCHPLIGQNAELAELDTDLCTTDTFVIEYPGHSGRAVRGVLVAMPENEEKYTQLQKYEQLLPVEIVRRST